MNASATTDKVVFRRWKDGHKEVLALFPEIDEGGGRCSSYQHIGQHSAADYGHCIRATKPASLDEPDVAALKSELESIGYTLEVRRRYTRP